MHKILLLVACTHMLIACTNTKPTSKQTAVVTQNKQELVAIKAKLDEATAGDFGEFMLELHRAEDAVDDAEKSYHSLKEMKTAKSSSEQVKRGHSAAERALVHRNNAEDALDRFLSPLENSIEDNSQRLNYIESLHVKEDTEIPIINMYFDFGRAHTSTQQLDKIKILIDFLREHPIFALKLTGYADTVGSKQQNLRLAERRNRAILHSLHAHGLPTNTTISIAVGEAEGPDETKNPQNRRVEIKPYVHGKYEYAQQ